MSENINLSERMVRVETQLDSIVQWQEEIKESIKIIQSSIQTMTIQNDMRYAFKRTESTVDWAMWIVVSTVILAILAFLLKKKS